MILSLDGRDLGFSALEKSMGLHLDNAKGRRRRTARSSSSTPVSFGPPLRNHVKKQNHTAGGEFSRHHFVDFALLCLLLLMELFQVQIFFLSDGL